MITTTSSSAAVAMMRAGPLRGAATRAEAAPGFGGGEAGELGGLAVATGGSCACAWVGGDRRRGRPARDRRVGDLAEACGELDPLVRGEDAVEPGGTADGAPLRG